MKIEYYIKEHYGKKRLYVKNNEQRMWLMKITKRSTITENHKKALEGLNIKLVEVAAPREE